jgi:hypothetical protein
MSTDEDAGLGARLTARDVLPLLALCLVAVVVWECDAVSGDVQFSLSNFDLYAEFQPRHAFAGSVLREGRLPLWDPHQIGGLPFLATYQGGVLYPPNLLYALSPHTGFVMGLLGLGHLIAAGGFCYLLCREFGLRPAASWLGALAFMVGGPTLFMGFQPNALASVPWLPAALYCTSRLAREACLRWALLLGGCIALQFLAGRDYSFVMTVHTVGLLAAFQLVWMVGVRQLARFGMRLFVAASLAGGLVAAQALPTLALAAEGGRTLDGLPGSFLEVYGPFPPSFFLANLLDPARGALRREYFGWIPLVCFVLGFRLWGRGRPAIFGSALSLLGLMLCFGSQTPLYGLYRELPLASSFRLPDRFVFLFALGFSVVAACGFDRLLAFGSDKRRSWRELAPRGLVLLGLAGLLFAVLEGGWLEAGLARAAQPWGWFDFYGLARDRFAGLDRSLPYLAAAATLLGAMAWRARSAKSCWPVVLVLLVASADLGFALRNSFLHPATRPEPALAGEACYEASAEVAGELGRHLGLRLPGSHAIKDKDGELFSRYSVTHYDPMVTRRQALYFEVMLEGSTPFFASPWNRRSLFMGFLTGLPVPQRKPLLDLLGTRVVLVDGRPEHRSPRVAAFLAPLRRVGGCSVEDGSESIPIDLYENPAALPRAFVVHRVVGASSPEEALARLVAPGFDARREAVVEGTPPAALSLGGEGEAEITDYEAERVVVRVETTQPGLVVLADSYDPDWVVTLDGEPATIEPTDGIFRGVYVPAGSSELVFSYRPRAFYLGATISGCTLAVGMWLWMGAPGRRSSGPSDAP